MPTDSFAAGNPASPDHERWLLQLGRATYAAAKVAGICFDILRVHRGTASDAMYDDALGTLASRLQPLLKAQPQLPGLERFLVQLESARTTRNDLIHALPVRDGLHRRRTSDGYYVRTFYDIASLEAATQELDSIAHEGNLLLYHDGGAAVHAWSAASRS